MNNKSNKWNDAYQDADISSATPALVLQENDYLLPESGAALDLACGKGGNALYLARLQRANFQVDAVDISPLVLDKLSNYSKQHALSISCHLRDIEAEGLPQKKQYDIIVVSYFLYRDLFPEIITALKPGGLLFYQTWAQDRVDESGGPNNPKFRLSSGELLALTQVLKPVYYRENALLGDVTKGLRNEAMLVAQKV